MSRRTPLVPGRKIDPSISSSRATRSPLNHYLGVLNRNAWLILGVTAVTLAIAAAVTFTKDPMYRASMTMTVKQSNPGRDATGELAGVELMQTVSQLLKSQIVADRVIANLGLDTTPSRFLKRLNSSYTPGSSVLTITFDARSREAAANTLGEVGDVYDQPVEQKLGPGASSQQSALPEVDVEQFDPPHAASEAISPKPARTLAFAGVLGLALGIGLAFLREGLDERIRSRGDAERWFGAPVIATLPRRLRGGRKATVVDARSANPSLVSAVEVLRANLLYARPQALGRSLLVTSPMPQEGKSFVAANLAFALAASGEDVIGIDADLHRPALHRYLGADLEKGGLTEVFSGRLEVEQALQQIWLPEAAAQSQDGREPGGSRPGEGSANGDGRLRVLTAGSRSGSSRDPGSLVSGERVEELIEHLREHASFVIFDGPPIFVAETFPLAIQADGVLVVAREGKTTRERALSAQSTLAGLGVEHLAVVLTDSDPIDDYRYR
jgi:tyrosine-protein kinase